MVYLIANLLIGLAASAPPLTAPVVPIGPRPASPLNPQLAGPHWEACANIGGGHNLHDREAGCTAMLDDPRSIADTRARAFLGRSMVHTDRGDLRRAMRDLDASIRVNPRYAMAYNNRAYIHIMRNDHAAALADLEIAGRLSPTNWRVYLNRGRVFVLSDRAEEAIGALTQGIRLHNQAPDLFAFRAQAYHQLGDVERALADWRTVRRLAPSEERGRRALCELVRQTSSDASERRAACR